MPVIQNADALFRGSNPATRAYLGDKVVWWQPTPAPFTISVDDPGWVTGTYGDSGDKYVIPHPERRDSPDDGLREWYFSVPGMLPDESVNRRFVAGVINPSYAINMRRPWRMSMPVSLVPSIDVPYDQGVPLALGVTNYQPPSWWASRFYGLRYPNRYTDPVPRVGLQWLSSPTRGESGTFANDVYVIEYDPPSSRTLTARSDPVRSLTRDFDTSDPEMTEPYYPVVFLAHYALKFNNVSNEAASRDLTFEYLD